MPHGGSRRWDGFWGLGGLASTIDHEAGSLETERYQVFKSNIDFETHDPLKLRPLMLRYFSKIDHRITKHMLSGKNSEYFKDWLQALQHCPTGPPGAADDVYHVRANERPVS